MQAQDRLEPYKPQGNHVSGCYGFLIQLYDLSNLWLHCILNLIESNVGVVDGNFDELGSLRLLGAFNGDASHANGLIKLRPQSVSMIPTCTV